MRKNGYSITEMLIVIVLLGVFTFVLVGTTSQAFKDTTLEEYKELEYVIEKQAILYGESLEVLKTEKNVIITLDDLVKNKYYITDSEDGLVVDPRNSNANLNGMKIKLTLNEDMTVSAKIIEEE